MKTIHLEHNVLAEIRAIEQPVALNMLYATHCYAETGAERVKPLSDEFAGFLRLRVGDHCVFFKESEDSITVHRIADRKDAYR